jgi:hypothetical protein
LHRPRRLDRRVRPADDAAMVRTMEKFKRIMVIIDLVLAAILMLAVLIGGGLILGGIASIGRQISSSGDGLPTDEPTDLPETPSLAPGDPADVIAQCRKAFDANDTDTYDRLRCNRFGN